jgi:uncharacterized RDD family membrane protein YckC
VARIDYRCVCGETISLETSQGGPCEHCGRRYSPEALRGAAAETLSVADLSSREVPEPAVPVADEDDELIDATLGHFRVLRRLGEGGMGSVYQALDQSLERYVALKVIRRAPRSAVADSPQLQRLFQEAIAQARVNHPHVVHIYYVGRDSESPFLAMELVGGPDLAERLGGGPLPFEQVIALAVQLADALRTCLQYDIVHGDIKPSNVLLTESGQAKLSDFGLATRLSRTPADSPGVAGTPDYLAPELAEGQPADMRSDMYSLGVTLFEMTFGRLPYAASGSSIRDRIEAHQLANVAFPDPWPAEVPEVWRNVLARLLAKAPRDRYRDYDALLADLQRLRPMSLPVARPMPRGLAWLTDLAIGLSVQGTLFGVAMALMPSGLSLGRPVVANLTSASVPLAFSIMQCRWGTSPGKKLFQIRIVDRHGLRPSHTRLAARGVAQMLPMWAVVLFYTSQALGIGILGITLGAILDLAALANAGYALFTRQRRAVHDLVFDTRVVLDAGCEDESSAEP